MSSVLPFTVLGGYLGAGKTTLLNHLLSSASDLKIAVLVNDFGSVNIDARLIRAHEGDTIEVANGCICCSMVDGLAAAIGQFRNRADRYDPMVIEASGVANPAKVAQYGQMYGFPLEGILVVVDAEQVQARAVDRYVGDTVIRQLPQADLLLLNKTDLVSTERLSELRHWLSGLAPGVPVIDTVRCALPPALLFGVHQSERSAAGVLPIAEHVGAFGTWTGTVRVAVEGAVFDHVFQLVGPRWTLERIDSSPDGTVNSTIVVIGRPDSWSAERLGALLAD